MEMDESQSINAIPAPAPRVFPRTRAGFLGIVMLDTRFPRPPGDVGHPQTFGVPVRAQVVSGAFPHEVVRSAAALRAGGMVARFVQAVGDLENQGALAITTSCGFLVLLQQDLQASVRVPVVSSSLLLLPGLLAERPQVGVLTISSDQLGAEHLLASGVTAGRLADVIVQGVALDGEFSRCILGNLAQMDLARAGADVVAAAVALKARAPALDTVVLECTNMPPYAAQIAQATGLRVLSLSDCDALFAPFRGSP